jgi:hypothetical protein
VITATPRKLAKEGSIDIRGVSSLMQARMPLTFSELAVDILEKNKPTN